MTDRVFYEMQGHDALNNGKRFRFSEQEITETIIRLARNYFKDISRILDVGCGGELIYDRWLSDNGKRPICVDFTFNFLRLAREQANLPLVQADGTMLPFSDSTFDGIVCSEALEHMPEDDRAIAEIARVLRPGGLLIVTVPNLWNASRLIEMVKHFDFTPHFMLGHLREYTPAHLRRLLFPYFDIEEWASVTFGWTGKLGGPIDRMIAAGVLKRFSKSLAFVARRNNKATAIDCQQHDAQSANSRAYS